MTKEDDQTAMRRHGITSETKTVYFYDGHAYDRLQDAVNYAELVKARAREPGASSP